MRRREMIYELRIMVGYAGYRMNQELGILGFGRQAPAFVFYREGE